jgi:beta-lactamase class A
MRFLPAVLPAVLLVAGCTAAGTSTTDPVQTTAAIVTTPPASTTTSSAPPVTSAPTATTTPTTAAPATTTSTTAAQATTVPGTTTLLPGTTTTATTSGTPDCAPEDRPCPAVTAAGEAYLAARVGGGVSGFVVLEVGGPTIASLNPRHGFYPASSVKALQHLAAVRWIESRPDPQAALDGPVPVSLDPCTADAATVAEPLREVLRAMMIDSDNLRANAVQDLVGLQAIGEAAAAAGMEDTRVVHRFACGGPANDPANRATAFDLARLFEGIGSGRLLDPEGRALFLSFLRRDVPGTLGAVVEEAAAGLPGGPGFAAEVHGKAGWWGTNLSFAGLVTLPTSRCPETGGRTFAVAAFVDGAASVAPGFEVAGVIGIVLEDEVRRAAAEYAGSMAACP